MEHLSFREPGAALSVHVLERADSGAPVSWEVQLWPAGLDELTRWLRLPDAAPAWALPQFPELRPSLRPWSQPPGPSGELLDRAPADQDAVPEPLLLDPIAALRAADQVALSVQDGAHAVMWCREPSLVIAAVRGFVASRTAARPHPMLLAELTEPLPAGHAWRLERAPTGRAALSLELVGADTTVRCDWEASAAGYWQPASRTAG